MLVGGTADDRLLNNPRDMAIPGESSFFIIPLAAAFTNGVLLLTNLTRSHRVNRILWLIYLLLISLNLSTTLMLTAANANRAMFWLFILRHFLFLFPVALCALAAALTGRRATHLLVLMQAFIALAAIAFADYTYATNSTLLVQEMQSRPWGFFPLLKPAALSMLGILFLGSYAIALCWLFRPREKIRFFSYPMLILLFATWWPGIMLNALPLAGFSVYPIGSVVDAVVSVVLSAYLHRNQADSGAWAKFTTTLTIAMSAVVIGAVGLFLLQQLGVWAALPVGALMSIATLLVYRHLHVTTATKPMPSLEQTGLSKQERRICELIHEGYSRSDILIFLNIADGTLRNHLQKIYAKTINPEGKSPPDDKDKLQRLTVYLNRLKT